MRVVALSCRALLMCLYASRFQTSPKGGLLCEHFVESRWAFATLEQQPGNAMVHAVAKVQQLL